MCISRLGRNLDAWKRIDAPDYVLEWLSEGVTLPFASDITPFEIRNRSLSQRQTDFVDSEIQRLLLLGFIEKCAVKPTCVSPLGVVPKRNNKLRLITDLRQLNSYCEVPKYRNEDIRDTVKLLKPNDRFVTTDIKDGFFHIPVHRDYKQYLGFYWKGAYFVWCVLVFGLCCSPYYFNKVLRPIISYLREVGLRVTVFVDDFLLAASVAEISDFSDQLVHTLQDLGFVINFEKSCLVPSQSIDYIGYNISSARGIIRVKAQAKRVAKLRRAIKKTISQDSVPARQLAKVLGLCVSVAWVVTPGKLFLRKAYRLLGTKQSWSDSLSLSEDVIQELEWWLNSVNYWNSKEICTESIQAQVITDASHLGWGAVYNGNIASGDWNRRVSCLSSNEREMLAILMAIKAFASRLSGLTVQILTDNISAMAYINHQGGPSPRLSELAVAIWAEAIEHGITLRCAHIAGKLNSAADSLSRTPDKHNWMLHPRVFRYLDTLFGKHTVDRFANCVNTQLPRFNSRYWEPLSEGVDALAQDNWGSENNYVNAPFCLIPRVLDIVQVQQAYATIIAPIWKAQPWFKRLQQMSIAPPLRVPNKPQIFRAMGPVPEPCRNRKWQIYAWRIYGGRIC